MSRYSLPTEKKVEAPIGGWEANTCYEVFVSVGASNPIWKAIFYTGFLNGPEGSPGGYATVWDPGSTTTIEFRKVYFMRPIRALCKR